MLVLTRKKGESLVIGGDIVVTVLSISQNSIRLGIDAPQTVQVWRNEIKDQMDEERKNSGIPSWVKERLEQDRKDEER